LSPAHQASPELDASSPLPHNFVVFSVPSTTIVRTLPLLLFLQHTRLKRRKEQTWWRRVQSVSCLSVETVKVSRQSRPTQAAALAQQPPATTTTSRRRHESLTIRRFLLLRDSLSLQTCPFPCRSTPGAPRTSSGRCQPPDQHSFLPTCATTKSVNNILITCGHLSDTHTIILGQETTFMGSI
jgi:hypothetical protein